MKPRVALAVRRELSPSARGVSRLAAHSNALDFFVLCRFGFAVMESSARPLKSYMEMTDGCGGGPHQGFPFCDFVSGVFVVTESSTVPREQFREMNVAARPQLTQALWYFGRF